MDDLDLIIPHQANGRIIDALAKKMKIPDDRVLKSLMNTGNTSSSSLPLALHAVLNEETIWEIMGLCAFGAGYTYGGAVLSKQSNYNITTTETRDDV